MTDRIYCTISAANYRGQVEALARSIRRWDPETDLVVLRFDADADDGDARGARDGWTGDYEVVWPDELGLPPAEYHRMAAAYGLVELATAVKPWLVELLLDRGVEHVVYLDPDVQLHAPLTPVFEALARAPIVLTPHILEPLPLDGRRVDDAALLHFGIFNLGFLAVAPAARPFLSWWQDRLRRGCVAHPKHGVFTDQGWVTLVPCLFDCEILRDPAYNVAYWNLDQRELAREGDRYTVEGRPLRFFHFSGFDPSAPGTLSRHIGDAPHVRIQPGSALESLCRAYAEELRSVPDRDVEYRFARSAAGLVLTPDVRDAYRFALEVMDRGGPTPPDPFDPKDTMAFERWLRERHFRVRRDTIRHRPPLRAHAREVAKHVVPESLKPIARRAFPSTGPARPG